MLGLTIIIVLVVAGFVFVAIQYGKAISEADDAKDESKARDYKRRLIDKLNRLRDSRG